ncbi:MAG: DUF4366 domain-containing protein [Acetatifactor sp.]
MNRLENLMEAAKLSELLSKKEKEEPKKCKCNAVVWVFVVIGVVAAIAGICYAVYRYFTPKYMEDFEDDFEDEFDDEEDDEEDFFVDEGEN